jgi:hypothetical protein
MPGCAVPEARGTVCQMWSPAPYRAYTRRGWALQRQAERRGATQIPRRAARRRLQSVDRLVIGQNFDPPSFKFFEKIQKIVILGTSGATYTSPHRFMSWLTISIYTYSSEKVHCEGHRGVSYSQLLIKVHCRRRSICQFRGRFLLWLHGIPLLIGCGSKWDVFDEDQAAQTNPS